MVEEMSAKGGSAFGGKIAIQAADLDDGRIDGTRVYILNLLRYFGQLDKSGEFLVYHKKDFNPELAPPDFPNYKIKKISALFLWTQTRFAYEIWKDQPDVLWMPMHNIPLLKSKKIKTIATVHDLAFRYFPEHFTKKNLFKLNLLLGWTVKKADKIIAVSESTKKDILKFYPEIKEGKIKVIHHGFDSGIFSAARDLEEENKLKKQLGIDGDYILYSGALQPRKNIEKLIEAFEIFKKRSKSGIKLVLAGEKAWMWENIEKKAKESPFSRDIVMPGKVKFCDIGHLFRGAGVFVLPSLYEGFGIPILEAQGSGVPVVAGDNSSIPEVAGNSAIFVDSNNAEQIADAVYKLLSDKNLRDDMIKRGYENVKRFSWGKCARETLEYLKS